MTLTVKVGQQSIGTVVGDDGSTPSGLSVTGSNPAAVQATLVGNKLTAKGIAPGESTLTLAASGYSPVNERVFVDPPTAMTVQWGPIS